MTSTASDVRRARAFRAARAFVLCFSISSCAKRASPASATSAQPPLAAPSAVSAPGVAMTPSASASAPVSPKAQTRCVTPQSAGVVPLSELKGDGLSEVAAVAAARRELKRVLEIPDDYFGSVQSAGDLVLLELWPLKARSARGVYGGSLRSGDGRLTAVIAQEMLLRHRALDPKMLRRLAEYLGVTPD
jgi:hypothetical protein